MSVQKIHSCCHPNHRPPPTPLDWEFLRSCRGWKWHTIHLRISAWGGSPTDFYLPHPCHARSVDAPPATLSPFTHHSPDNVLLPSVLSVELVPPPSYVVRTLPSTGSLMSGRGRRSSLPYSQHFSKVTLYQTTRSGHRTPPSARLGPLMRPGHHLHRKRRRDVTPTFPTCTALLPPLPPIISSVVPLRPPPH